MNQVTLKSKLSAAAVTAGVDSDNFIYGHLWQFNDIRFPGYPALLFERFERPQQIAERQRVEVNFFVFHDYNELLNDDINVKYDLNDDIATAFITAINTDSSLYMEPWLADDGDWRSVNFDEGTKYTTFLNIYC